MIDDVASDPLTADTPRPRRAGPGGGAAEAETAQTAGAAEPKADGEDTESAESLSFADLLNQLEDMARPAEPIHVGGVRLTELAACGLAQRFIRTLLSPHTLPPQPK